MIAKLLNKKQKKSAIVENTFIPAPLGTQMRWWTEKGVAEGSPGNFNKELYIRYQMAICNR